MEGFLNDFNLIFMFYIFLFNGPSNFKQLQPTSLLMFYRVICMFCNVFLKLIIILKLLNLFKLIIHSITLKPAKIKFNQLFSCDVTQLSNVFI